MPSAARYEVWRVNGLPDSEAPVRETATIDDATLARVRSLFPSATGLMAIGSPPSSDLDLELVVVTPPPMGSPPPRYLWQGSQRVVLHLHRPQLYGVRIERMLSTPWGRAKLATNDQLWELRSAQIIHDPQGALDAARKRSGEFLAGHEARMARLRATELQLRMLTRRLSGLGGIADREGRNRAALPVATGIYSLADREAFRGLCGLVLVLLCQIGDVQPGRAGLWAAAQEVARRLELCGVDNPFCGIRSSKHMEAVGERANQGELRTRLTLTAMEAVDVATSALSRNKPGDGKEIRRLAAYYRRLVAGDVENALVLLRGEMARELHSDPAYLAVCGIEPGNSQSPADAWPELLARLSSALVAAQAMTTLMTRLTPEMLNRAANAAAED